MAALALVVSCVSTLFGAYFEPPVGLGDAWFLGMNIVWAFIIAWTIYDLVYRRADVTLTIMLVGAIICASLVWDLVERGFGPSQLFYSIELAMFVFAYFLLRTSDSRAWYAAKNS